MLKCLDREIVTVREELDDYRSSILIVLTPGGRYVRQAHFITEEEKIVAYSGLVAEAKTRLATVIVTVNATRSRHMVPGEEDGYWWGKLEAEQARDCVSITASGPGMESIGLDLTYAVQGTAVHFDFPAIFCSTVVGMLPEWPGEVATSIM